MIAERMLMGVLLTGIAIGCAVVLQPFFSALLWAGILVFTTWPVFEWLRIHLRVRRGGAAVIMVLLTAVLIVLPIALAAPGGAQDVQNLRQSLETLLNGGLPSAPPWLFTIPLFGPTLADYWNGWAADLSVMVNFFRPYFGMIAENGLSLLLGIAGGVVQFVLALFIAFFFWLSGERLAVQLGAVLHRIAGAYAERLIRVTGLTVRGVVYGILGTAIVQGILTSFGLYMAGVPRPMLLGGIAGFLSVLPIGAPVVWIPSALWLLSIGHTGWGIFLAVYGGVAISGADHLIRPYFISRGAQLPFLLTVLGVLGGALAFGLLGIFLGPVLLGVGFTLVAEFARPAVASLNGIPLAEDFAGTEDFTGAELFDPAAELPP
jgi:predicted PurR-regulated permease PerM